MLDSIKFRHQVRSDSNVKDSNIGSSPGILWNFVDYIEILMISNRFPVRIQRDCTIETILLGNDNQFSFQQRIQNFRRERIRSPMYALINTITVFHTVGIQRDSEFYETEYSTFTKHFLCKKYNEKLLFKTIQLYM